MKLEKELPKIKKNVLLKNYTTFKIGGPAKYFYIAKTKEDLIKASLVAKKLKLPFFILGGGSNLLVSDKGFNGLVIKIQNSKFGHSPAHISNGRGCGEIQTRPFLKKGGARFKIFCEAGTPLAKLAPFGLEWVLGIPGTVGGAVYGNAGAFGKSMKDVVEEVEVFDTETEKIKIFKKKDCQFSYRESIFKKRKNLIILSVKIKPKKANFKKINQYLDYKKKTQPLDFSSAGCIFKNPPFFSAGQLIEKCNLKGKRIGNVKISEKHANFIINLGKGKASDVIKLIKLMKKEVKKKFGIELEEEIQYLGFKIKD